VVLAMRLEVRLRRQGLDSAARWCGVPLRRGGSSCAPGVSPGPTLTTTEHQSVRAVRRVMRHWRFATGPCLREALLIGRILRRLRPEVAIGVVSDGRGVRAHAWLEIDGHRVGSPGEYLELHDAAGVR
jgi:hypothetical protein